MLLSKHGVFRFVFPITASLRIFQEFCQTELWKLHQENQFLRAVLVLMCAPWQDSLWSPIICLKEMEVEGLAKPHGNVKGLGDTVF